MNYSKEQRRTRYIAMVKQTRARRKRHKIMKYVLRTITCTTLALCITATVLLLSWLTDFTSSIDYSVLDNFTFRGERVKMYDHEGNILKTFYEQEDTKYVDIDTLRDDYINFFVSHEDVRFYEHNGIDTKGILRAIVVNLTEGDLSQGASTITQQLVRSQVLTTQKTFERKLTEMFLAMELETRISKDQILEQYLNTIYFGYGNYGIESASQFYYGKTMNDLSLSQMCSIIPIIQSPNNFNPVNNIDLNNEKRVIVLDSLLEKTLITQEEYSEALADESYRDVKMSRDEYNTNVTAINGYYVESAFEQVVSDLILQNSITREQAIALLHDTGAQIYTYYDPAIDAMLTELALTRKYAIDEEIQTAVVILDNNGIVKGILGGYDAKPTNYSLNRATQTTRNPGSTFKPIVSYVPAMEYLGYTPETKVTDAKRDYNTTSGLYSPNNYNHRYLGVIDLRTAVALSINSVAVDTLHTVSINKSFELAKKLGISTLVDMRNGYTDRGLSMALGGLTDGVKVIEMATAYNTLKTSKHMEPKFYSKVLDRNGNLLITTEEIPKYNHTQVITTSSALYITDTMLEVTQTGTGRSLKDSPVPIAGKTGTTNDSKDLWFVGYTPDYTISLWYGYDTPKEINTASLHLNLFEEIVRNLYTIYPDNKLSLFTTDVNSDDFKVNVKNKKFFTQDVEIMNDKH